MEYKARKIRSKDRISELPDDSLQHILSYLPPKEIVRTCALSTRWQSLWNIVPFEFNSRNEPKRFLDLVQGTEPPIPENARIRRFQIYLTMYRDTYIDYIYNNIVSIMEWISEAAKHSQFEELDLTFQHLEGNLYLPHTLFTCQSLTSLKLYMYGVTITNANLRSRPFPRLRTLHLSCITFMDKCFAEQLFSTCLVLGDLSLYQCSWNTTSDITIAVPSLQRLTIYLNENLSRYPLIIHCPNLKFFEFSGYPPLTITNTNPRCRPFPRLRTLLLNQIRFMDKCFAEKLFAGCLVLEELFLCNCSWKTPSDITISIPSLQRLSINLCQNPSDNRLIIRCQNLKFFKLSSYFWFFKLVLDLPSLVEAYIVICKDVIYQKHIQFARTFELFERIRGVESLKLSFETLPTISYVEDFLANEIPTFHNLTRLALLGKYSEYGNLITATALMHILHKSPKLQSIDFPHGLKLNDTQEKTHSLKDDVPVCLIHCLERFRVCRFRGNDEEVSFLKYILEHASVLKSFSVHCREELSENLERKEMIRLELKQLCKEHCEFSFI